MSDPASLLMTWLERQVPPGPCAWFREQVEALGASRQARTLHVALGMIPRKLGKADLALSAADLALAVGVRAGWDPSGWSVDQAARIRLLCEIDDGDAFPAVFADLCRSAEVSEAVALYRGLPLYTGPGRLVAQAAEGLRTSMRSVFEAIAHRSPFPREELDEHPWNHMVLKALFVDSALHPIQGLDERANPVLARMLCDYAHERWAAGRSVSPELWRCVGPFAEGPMVDDLERVLLTGDDRERWAAALALAASPAVRARRILERAPEEATAVREGRLSWNGLAGAP